MSSTNKISVLILAAGLGTRMHSKKPKMLHTIFSRPLLYYPLDLALELNPAQIIPVVSDPILNEVTNYPNYTKIITPCIQEKPLGTGHAVQCGLQHISPNIKTVFILCGDIPAFSSQTAKAFIKHHIDSGCQLSVLTALLPNPFGFGRIIKNGGGDFTRIVEEKDANPQEKTINEINSGIYCIDIDFLRNSISHLSNNNSQTEFYLTDIIEIAFKQGLSPSTYKIDDYMEIFGVNTLEQLATIQRHIQNKILTSFMANGVRIIDPNTTYISPEVCISPDVIIHPCTHIHGKTIISEGAIIGPNVWLEDVNIAKNKIITTEKAVD